MKGFTDKTCPECGCRYYGSIQQEHCSPKCSVRFRLKPFLTEKDKCWPWPGAREPAGYGQVRRNGKIHKTHRIAYEIFNGPIPNGMYVCHKCDNPPCCNPAHLWLGTHADNMSDRDIKGRNRTAIQPKGEAAHAGHKLTNKQVRNIRRLWADGASMRSIGSNYGVTHECVRKIVRRITWTHI